MYPKEVPEAFLLGEGGISKALLTPILLLVLTRVIRFIGTLLLIQVLKFIFTLNQYQTYS